MAHSDDAWGQTPAAYDAALGRWLDARAQQAIGGGPKGDETDRALLYVGARAGAAQGFAWFLRGIEWELRPDEHLDHLSRVLRQLDTTTPWTPPHVEDVVGYRQALEREYPELDGPL